MASLNFNAANVAPETAMEAVPAGWYKVIIMESEMKPTSAGTGSYLQVGLKILEGPFVGKKFIDRMNLNNPNPVAVQIAQGRLSAYCHATGVIQCADSMQLHNIPIQVKVNVKTDPTGQYSPSNEIKSVKHISEAVDTQAPSLPGVPATGVTGATPSWAGQAAVPAPTVGFAPVPAVQQAMPAPALPVAPQPVPVQVPVAAPAVQAEVPLTTASAAAADQATPPWLK